MMIADVHFRKLSSNRSNELDVHPEKIEGSLRQSAGREVRSRIAHLTASAFQAIRISNADRNTYKQEKYTWHGVGPKVCSHFSVRWAGKTQGADEFS